MAVKKYVTTKVEVEALQITSLTDIEKIEEIKAFMGNNIIFSGEGIVISTKEGDVIGKVGDYIVKGLAGEFWPISEDIFNVKYIPADEKMDKIIPNFFCIKTAIDILKTGKAVSRAGWNGDGMFLVYCPSSKIKVDRLPLLGVYSQGTELEFKEYIIMHTADGKVVPWSPSVSDILSNDYFVVNNKLM